MNTKKLALFGGAAVVVAGGLVYSLGIFPPASGREGQGAIGERKVYRAEQPADAAVTPGAAPVAASANAASMKGQTLSGVQDGQLFQMSNGQMYQLHNGRLLALQNGMTYHLNDGQMYRLQDGKLHDLAGNMAPVRYGFVLQLQDGMMMQLQNGQMYKLSNGELMHQMAHVGEMSRTAN